MDHLGLITLLIPALLFIVFLWFFISPILLDKTVIAPAARRSKDIDTGLHSIENQGEQASLLNWMRRSSRGRFADTEGNHRPHNVKDSSQRRSEAYHRFSLSTFFARSSLVPHIAPVTPPPIYTVTTPDQFSPTVSSPLTRPPLECVPSRQERMLSVPRIFVPARRISLRSVSGPTLSPTMSTLRPQMVARSVSISESTLLSPSSTIASLSSRIPVPSKALVLPHESPGSNVSIRMPVIQTRTDAMLPIGGNFPRESAFTQREIRSKGTGYIF